MINQSSLIAIKCCQFNAPRTLLLFAISFTYTRTAYILLFLFVFLFSVWISVSFRNEFLFAQQTLDVIDIMFIILISCVK